MIHFATLFMINMFTLSSTKSFVCLICKGLCLNLLRETVLSFFKYEFNIFVCLPKYFFLNTIKNYNEATFFQLYIDILKLLTYKESSHFCEQQQLILREKI